jgi:hypothetical protein
MWKRMCPSTTSAIRLFIAPRAEIISMMSDESSSFSRLRFTASTYPITRRYT